MKETENVSVVAYFMYYPGFTWREIWKAGKFSVKVTGVPNVIANTIPPEHPRVYPKNFRTDRLERELQMVQFSATRCSCIAIL
jgi:hypothetical protein